MTLIAEKVAKGPSRGRFGADPGKQLGDHPSLGAVAVKSGRYGAYVTAGGVNATIPSDKEKDTITLAEAIALIDERAAKGGGKKAKKAAKPKAEKAAKPAKAEADADVPEACEESGGQEGRQAEIGFRQQGARAGRGGREDLGRKTSCGGQDDREEERRKGTWVSEAKTRQWLSNQGRHRRLHPRQSRKGRHHARSRASSA